MPSIGPAEVLVILVLALLIFGPQKMPEIGRQVGRAMREFRKAQTAVRTELRDALDITGGAVTGTNSAPPSYGTPAPAAPTAPTDPAGAATAPAGATDPAAPAVPADPAPASAAPAPAAAADDDDPAFGRGLGAASHPVTPTGRPGSPTAGADDDDPAFGRRAGTPVEPH